jgi:DNA-binding response OmpR family regulator
MAPRSLRLLHVEDDRIQRALIAHHLAAMREMAFEIIGADSEEEAVHEFSRGGFEFVIIDYHLAQGNGLDCLHQLRRLDPIVPIVAISGTATPEIAADLVQAGADDYISKEDLNSKMLARSVRSAINRADAFRKFESNNPTEPAPVDGLFQEICQDFLGQTGPRFLTRLEEFEAAARQAKMTPGQVQRLFQRVLRRLDPKQREPDLSAKALLRPILLEILLRLFG